MFLEKRFFSEEKALFLLHVCDYNVEHAINVLKEKETINRKTGESDSSDAEEVNPKKFLKKTKLSHCCVVFSLLMRRWRNTPRFP